MVKRGIVRRRTDGTRNKANIHYLHHWCIMQILYSCTSNSIYVWPAGVFGIDQDIIQIHHKKDIKLFNEDLVDVALKTGWSIRKTKGHDLVVEMTVSSTKSHFLLITFLNPHLIIIISKILLDKLLGLA